MSMRDLPDMYARAQRAEGIHIKQITNYYVSPPCTIHVWANSKQLKPYACSVVLLLYSHFLRLIVGLYLHL